MAAQLVSFLCVCVCSQCDFSRSRSAKEKQKRSTSVMTWNVASWLGGRMTFCLSLFACPSVSLFSSSVSLSASSSLSLSLLCDLSFESCQESSRWLSSQITARDWLQLLWNVYWHSVQRCGNWKVVFVCSLVPLSLVFVLVSTFLFFFWFPRRQFLE